MTASEILSVSMEVQHNLITVVAALKIKTGNSCLNPFIPSIIPQLGSSTALQRKLVMRLIKNPNSLYLPPIFKLLVILLPI